MATIVILVELTGRGNAVRIVELLRHLFQPREQKLIEIVPPHVVQELAREEAWRRLIERRVPELPSRRRG